MAFDWGSIGNALRGAFSDPLFTAGIGLLSAPNDVSTTEGLLYGLQGAQLGQRYGLLADERELRKTQNEIERLKLSETQQRLGARDRLVEMYTGQPSMDSLLGASGYGPEGTPLDPGFVSERLQSATDPATSMSTQNPEFMKNLALASPQSFYDLISDQTDRVGDPLVTLADGRQVSWSELTPNMQELIGGGMDPTDPNFRETLQKAIERGDSTAADRVLATAQAELAALEARQAVRDERLDTFNRHGAIQSTFDNTRELIQINERLRGTLGETGLGFDDARKATIQGVNAVKRLFGFSDQEAQRVVDDMNRFEQLSLEENARNVATLREALGGRVTQFEFGRWLETGASPSQPPSVNEKIFYDQLTELKRLAEFESMPIPPWVDREIKRLEGEIFGAHDATTGMSSRAGRDVTLPPETMSPGIGSVGPTQYIEVPE